MAQKLAMGRGRPQDKPYIIITDGDWETRVLKAYTGKPDERYARWFVAVKTPFTFGGFDLGDTYIADIRGTVTFLDDAVPLTDLPEHLRANIAAYGGR